MRYVVGVGTIAYAIFFPILAIAILEFGGSGMFVGVGFYAPVVIVGAVLIILKNRWGPGVTALAMLFGSFWQGYLLINAGVRQAVEDGKAEILFSTFAGYLVPALIFIWCVREERRRPPAQ